MWQSLDDGRYALMKAKISSVIHDDTKYQKGMLHMRTQKCFAVKVNIPNWYLNYAITSVCKWKLNYNEIVYELNFANMTLVIFFLTGKYQR